MREKSIEHKNFNLANCMPTEHATMKCNMKAEVTNFGLYIRAIKMSLSDLVGLQQMRKINWRKQTSEVQIKLALSL